MIRRLCCVCLLACGARTELGSTRASDAAPLPDDCGASLASGPSWSTPFGPARPVCLSPTSPANCPSDALVYGGGFGWSADVSQLGGATWIWRPGISASDTSDFVQVSFTRTFTLHGVPGGSLSLAADDFAEVVVNGTSVGSTGSTTDASVASDAQNHLTTFDLAAHLVDGPNTITIAAQNGPPSFGGCATSCAYTQNPAGVVFGGKLTCE